MATPAVAAVSESNPPSGGPASAADGVPKPFFAGAEEEEYAEPMEFVTKNMLEQHLEEARRREARTARVLEGEWEQARRWRWCGALLLFLALAGLISGICLLTKAEGDRLHGWRQSRCRIVRNFAHGHNVTTSPFDNVCVYFSVEEVGKAAEDAGGTDRAGAKPPLCAVPASIAGRGGLVDPPACANLPTEDLLAVDYWKIVADRSEVECMVPAHSGVPADRCVATATTGGPGAALWRTWLDRFVYLVRDPREATDALHVATRVQRSGGAGLIVAGGLLFPLAVAAMFLRAAGRCLSSCHQGHRRLRNARARRYAEAHKMY